MCLRVSYKKKFEKNVSLKSLKEGVGYGVGSVDPELYPDPLVRGSDPDPR
jgi:hypothetical protein